MSIFYVLEKSVVAGKFNPEHTLVAANRRSTPTKSDRNLRPEYTPRQEKSISETHIDRDEGKSFTSDRIVPSGSGGSR